MDPSTLPPAVFPGFASAAGDLAVLCVVGLVTLFQGLDAEREYRTPSPGRWPWHMHHDEKILVHDARVLRGRSGQDARLTDYRPYPVSAAYGLGGPLLAAAGFRLFGLNNRGLRTPFILVSGLSNLWVCLALLAAAPGAVGAMLCMVHLLCWGPFSLSRHAILENVLNAVLAGLLWLYATAPDLFLDHLPWLGFFAALTVFFKPNFLVYVHLLFLAVLAVERPGLEVFVSFLAASGLGVVFFEGIHMGMLAKLGIARFRYFNLGRALRQHAGQDVQVLQSFRREGLRILPNYLRMLSEWYGLPTQPRTAAGKWIRRFLPAAMALLLGFAMIRASSGAHGRLLGVLLLFLVLYLALSSCFFFYTKRAISTFPALLLLLGVALEGLWGWSPAWFAAPLAPLLWAGTLLLGLGLTVRLLRHTLGASSRTEGVAANSRGLDRDLPAGVAVYAHCYAARFFWQSRRARFLSADDQIMDNRRIVDWALEQDGTYLLLSGRGGPIRLCAAPRLGFLKRYASTETESDLEDDYRLFRIVEENRPEHEPPAAVLDACLGTLGWNPSSEAEGSRPAGLDLGGLRLLATLAPLLQEQDAEQAEEILHLVRITEHRTALVRALEEGQTYALVPEDGGSVDVALLERVRHVTPCVHGKLGTLYLFEMLPGGPGAGDAPDPVDPECLTRLYRHASRLKTSGRHEAAAWLFLLVEKSGFHPAGVSYHLGELALAQGDLEGAAARFTQCLAHDPNHRSAARHLRALHARS